MTDSTTADQSPLCLPWQRLDLHVPRVDESVFAVPGLESACQMAETNRHQWSDADWDMQGRSLSQLREWTRRAVCNAAREFTLGWCSSDELGDVSETEAPHVPWFVSGHQPAISHPGVWVKNVAVAHCAAQSGGISLNLVVDNDTFTSSAVRVPTGTHTEPVPGLIPYDARRAEQPWEDAVVRDPDLFASFGDRVREALAPWDVQSIVGDFWQRVMQQYQRTAVLAECLTAARNDLERSWGTRNLELPISRLCQLDPFLWFASHILVQLPRFQKIHNQALREYREINRVRSRTHPVPDLQELDGWLEAPFWVWKSHDTQRGRVWARQQGRDLLLSDGRETFVRLPITPDGEACCAVEVLRTLPERGIHLRTRALTTTMFARTCLADLFVHGIGGAKYDELTDRILARFGGIRPPKFLALSATLQLPLNPFAAVPDDARALRRQLRDLEKTPERNLDNPHPPEADQLKQSIQQLIDGSDWQKSPTGERRDDATAALPKPERRQQYRQLRELRDQLSPATQQTRAHLTEKLSLVEQELRANQVLCDREYAFCLHSEERLQMIFEKVRAGLSKQ